MSFLRTLRSQLSRPLAHSNSTTKRRRAATQIQVEALESREVLNGAWVSNAPEINVAADVPDFGSDLATPVTNPQAISEIRHEMLNNKYPENRGEKITIIGFGTFATETTYDPRATAVDPGQQEENDWVYSSSHFVLELAAIESAFLPGRISSTAPITSNEVVEATFLFFRPNPRNQQAVWEEVGHTAAHEVTHVDQQLNATWRDNSGLGVTAKTIEDSADVATQNGLQHASHYTYKRGTVRPHDL